MSVRGIIGGLVGMAVMAAAIAAAVVVFANGLVVEQVDSLMTRLRNSGAIKATYATAEADLLSQSITITGIDIQGRDKDIFRVSRIDVDRFDFFNARQPKYADVRLTGGAIIAGDGSPLSALFRQVGLTRLTGTLRLGFTAEHDKRLFTLTRLRIATPELGELSLSGRFGNWSRQVLTSLQRAIAGGGPDAFRRSRLVIYEAKVDYRDRGLVNRYLKFLADRQDTSLSKYKAGIRRDLRKIKKVLKGRKLAPVRKMIDILANFIRKPRVLQITAEPGSPARLSELVKLDLAALRTRLQLSIKAK
jgi:hypothetical protein